MHGYLELHRAIIRDLDNDKKELCATISTLTAERDAMAERVKELEADAANDLAWRTAVLTETCPTDEVH
jgi:uncharacterized coiled-coil DUF342 family protein